MSSLQRSTPHSLPGDHAIHFGEDARPSPDIRNTNTEPSYLQGISIRRAASITNVSERTPLLHQDNANAIRQIVDESVCTVAHADENTPPSQIFREELSTIVRYSLPVFGTQLFEYSFLMASVISLGHLSTIALASATLGMMTASVTGYSLVQGSSSALDTLLPPAWTSNAPHMVGLWTQRMTLMSAFALVPILVTWFNAEPILLMLHQEPEVARLAGVYLKYASWGLPAYTFNCISRRYFQSQGLFTVPTRIIVAIAPINAFLNWSFVHHLGLGFPGAPIATSFSFTLVSLVSIVYAYLFVPRTAWVPLGSGVWKGWGLLARLGVAGVGQIASEWWCWELVGLAASFLGPVPLAAQSVLLLSASCTYQAPFALSVAASVRIGNLLGEGKARRAGLAARTSIFVAVAMAGIWCTLFLVFRNKWAYLFNNDPEVVSLVASIIPLLANFQIFDGTSAIVSGVLRARGMQGVGALLNLSSYYLLGIPLGLVLAFHLGFGLAGLWIGLLAALASTAMAGLFIGIVWAHWEIEVERARKRVGGKESEIPGY